MLDCLLILYSGNAQPRAFFIIMKHKNISPKNSTVTAILIDGTFFLKRYRNVFINGKNHYPNIIVENFYRMVHLHIESEYLYRIIFYDCQPFANKSHNPISNKVIDFSKTVQARIEGFYLKN